MAMIGLVLISDSGSIRHLSVLVDVHGQAHVVVDVHLPVLRVRDLVGADETERETLVEMKM